MKTIREYCDACGDERRLLLTVLGQDKQPMAELCSVECLSRWAWKQAGAFSTAGRLEGVFA